MNRLGDAIHGCANRQLRVVIISNYPTGLVLVVAALPEDLIDVSWRRQWITEGILFWKLLGVFRFPSGRCNMMYGFLFKNFLFWFHELRGSVTHNMSPSARGYIT